MNDPEVPPVPKYIETWESRNDPLAKKYPLQIALHPEQFLEKGGDYLDTITRHTSNMTNDILHEYLDTLSSIRRDKLCRIK